MKSHKFILAAAAVLAFSFSQPEAKAQIFDFNKSLDCNWVDPIQSAYLANHLTYKSEDAELQKRVIEQYIKRQDPAKIYLLQADVDSIKSSMKNLFENLKKKDCKFIPAIQETVVKRAGERVEFVKSYLGNDFKFNNQSVG